MLPFLIFSGNISHCLLSLKMIYQPSKRRLLKEITGLLQFYKPVRKKEQEEEIVNSLGFIRNVEPGTFGKEQFVFYFRVCKHIRDFLLKGKIKPQRSARPIFSPRPYCYHIKRGKFNELAFLLVLLFPEMIHNLFIHYHIYPFISLKSILLAQHFLEYIQILFFKEIGSFCLLFLDSDKFYSKQNLFHYNECRPIIFYTGNEKNIYF